MVRPLKETLQGVEKVGSSLLISWII